MLVENEFYYLMKIQVSGESMEMAETSNMPKVEHMQIIGDAAEKAIRESDQLEDLVDNIDFRQLDSDIADVPEGLMSLAFDILMEEWEGDVAIMHLARHLDSLRQLYLALK